MHDHEFMEKRYSEAVSVYLTCALSKVANIGSTIASWMNDRGAFRETFARQAIQMTWDYAEANPFADVGGSFSTAIAKGALAISNLPAEGHGLVLQANASTQEISAGKIVSTDPPYYDNVPYADLSDFFYVWLRKTFRPIFPQLFATIGVPKTEELVADPFRHKSKISSEQFFLHGMTEAMRRIAEQVHPAFPTTIYYAFKQSDTNDVGTGNTGWETFLEAVLKAGFAITGTWPMKTEGSGRLRGQGSNALASSIILVCRQRSADAPTISRREFLRELKEELAEAVEVMIGGAEGLSPVAPVDLAQAVIGPGMAIFSKHSAVLEADGSPMTVHSALLAINRMLIEGGDDFDSDTQFCLSWFDQLGWAAGEFGQADVLARAKGTSVERVRDAGVAEAGCGKVRLLKPAEYPADWDPKEDNHTPVWEALHQMIRALQSQSESAAGALLAHMPERAEPIRNLAYRLYTLCERKGWTDEARGYNELITSWLGIEAASHESGHLGSQAKLDI
jgi:putative DNA methylase